MNKRRDLSRVSSYTPEERAAMAKAFRSTLRRYKGGGICFALPVSEAGDKCCAFISARLGKHAFVHSWLYEQGFINTCCVDLRKYRRAWIRQMINELETAE